MPGILFSVPITIFQVSLNINNNYNYVNYRRAIKQVVLYNSRRSNGYERQHPNNNFSRNTNVSNRYELEQRSNRNEINYSQNRNQSSRNTSQRGMSQRDISQETNRHEKSFPREGDQRDYSQK
jgi:hypothetical protein